eukprot:g1843.t1
MSVSGMAKFRNKVRQSIAMRRISDAAKNSLDANVIRQRQGEAGLYRSTNYVSAFQSSTAFKFEKSWGVSEGKANDWVVIAAPKKQTKWMHDMYAMDDATFQSQYTLVEGSLDEYRQIGTVFAFRGDDNIWVVHDAANPERQHKMKDDLFQEAYEPAFLDNGENRGDTVVRCLVEEEQLKAKVKRLDHGDVVLGPNVAEGCAVVITSGEINVRDEDGTVHTISIGECLGFDALLGKEKGKGKGKHVATATCDSMTCECIYVAREQFERMSDSVRAQALRGCPTSDVRAADALLQRRTSNAMHSNFAMESITGHTKKLKGICKKFFSMCDTSGDGAITAVEFTKMLRSQASKFGPSYKRWAEKPILIFQKIDADSSGEIDCEEFTEYVISSGDEMLLALIHGATASRSSAVQKSADAAQRESNHMLVESLRQRIVELEKRVRQQRDMDQDVLFEAFADLLPIC